MDWNEEVRDRLAAPFESGGYETSELDDDILTALRHIDTLTGYVEDWKARAEKDAAEVERLREAIGEWADMNAAKDSTIKALVESGDRLAYQQPHDPEVCMCVEEWAEAKRAALRGGE